MAAPPGNSRLRTMLQAAVQSVQWTYSLFWQICPQQGILVWGEGYYNGAIKTTKTVQPIESTCQQASLQRSQQLRDLYDSLSAADTVPPPSRPSVALSPEDLTESEWFYLMCVSFTFPAGIGLPGKAYIRRQHIWFSGANEVDCKIFSRGILAKSARIQTILCIPLLDGVVELGSIEKIEEDIELVQHVKTFFIDHSNPALSGHSTSNPATALYPPIIPNQQDPDENEDEPGSEAELGYRRMAGERSELMQVDTSEDIQVGSPEDGSNNLDADFNLLAMSQSRNDFDRRRRRQGEVFRAEMYRLWGVVEEPAVEFSGGGGVQLTFPETPQLQELTNQDTHYSQTVSTVLHCNEQLRSPKTSSAATKSQSAFLQWPILSDHHPLLHIPTETTSQRLLKYILFTVPVLHNQTPTKSSSDASNRFRKSFSRDDLTANHVLAERRRREKLNEKFIILRSLLPSVTKMDRASVLDDTIEYLKQLRNKIQDLESRNRQIEAEQRSRSTDPDPDRNRIKKLRIVEVSGGGAKAKTTESPSPAPPLAAAVEVSIIESDALIQLQCLRKEGLLLDIMMMLRELRVKITAVQSCLNDDGTLISEMRAKVKDNVNGKKTSIMEVKRAINQIIQSNCVLYG